VEKGKLELLSGRFLGISGGSLGLLSLTFALGRSSLALGRSSLAFSSSSSSSNIGSFLTTFLGCRAALGGTSSCLETCKDVSLERD